ncbi:protein DpdF [Hyalangium gracile]|uniref:protein DpdF n=1 Tax=Hyalangium gracile TaxID=394092 RepID=UPI001CC998B2|nr:protein DpdF [Hyalangium gracile]
MKEAVVDPFEHLRRYLVGEVTASPKDFTEPCHRRLVSAVEALRGTEGPPAGVPGRGDLAVLVRHVLRREQERQGSQVRQSLLVPAAPPWLEPSQWESFGLDAFPTRTGFVRVQASEWHPSWLPETQDIEKAAFAETPRRTYEPAPGDPVIAIAKRSSYRSVAQREALRCALSSPPDSTLVAVLPTGAGKSLLAQVPALWLSQPSGIAVVVVPTTALGIDQERALGTLVAHPTAYFSATDAEARARNQGIRQRIRQGTQRMVFTSPESLLGSLSSALYDAASAGLLRLLVVDEAHMIEQWGEEFRSAFQELAGIRRGLLRACPKGSSFRTLLLTATLTESCLDTLETLFKEPGEFGIIAAVQLRPEPSFHFARCASPSEKQDRILEALRHLPRPLILYTTEVADAQSWTRLLRDQGFLRCEEVTGQTSTPERQRVLRQWQAGATDMVVATSAFGLGVDKEDVRAVVHACVPETVDRYYQEVGRGGRDGRASISLVVYTGQDVKVAQDMSQHRIISIALGQPRWDSMFKQAEPLGNGRYRVPLDVSRTLQGDGIDMAERSYNVLWNIRTLTLMTRAGLLRLSSEAPPRLAPEAEGSQDAEAWYAQEFERYSRRRVVEILDEAHNLPETWTHVIEPERQRGFARRGHELMMECLRGARCIAEILAEVYRIPGRPPRQAIDVAPACGGCAACWRAGRHRTTMPAPPPRSPWRPSRTVEPGLRVLMGGGEMLVIYYQGAAEDASWPRHRRRAFRWFVGQGLQDLVAPREVLEDYRMEFERAPHLVFFHEELRFPDSELLGPLLVFHPRERPVPSRMYVPARTAEGLPTPPRVVFLPQDAVDPTAPHRRLRDVLDCRSLTFDEFRVRVSL